MATLFDVRMFHNRPNRYRTSDPRGEYVATTQAKQGALREIPDMAAVREALPRNWRKAFDRANGFWWNKHDASQPGRMELYTLRGNELIATLYATRREA